MYGVGDVAGANGDRWAVGVEGSRTGVTGNVRSEIRPRRSDKIDATCPSSPPLEGAGVVDGRPPGISEGRCLAGSNESMFGG